MEYFKKHLVFLASVHFLGGVGVGILLTSPLFSPNQVWWGFVFIGLAVLGHIFAWISKK